MSDNDLPRASLDRLIDALNELYKTTLIALEETITSVYQFLKGIT